MRGNRSRDTQPEVRLRSALHRRGLRYRKHVRPLQSLRFEADIVFRRDRVAVAVDGCIWHACPDHGMTFKTNAGYWREKIARNVQRDRRNERLLSEAGWRLVRVWEHEPPEAAARRIEALLRTRSS
jgi:DNA mismatch endonuclease, patch repair protein